MGGEEKLFSGTGNGWRKRKREGAGEGWQTRKREKTNYKTLLDDSYSLLAQCKNLQKCVHPRYLLQPAEPAHSSKESEREQIA